MDSFSTFCESFSAYKFKYDNYKMLNLKLTWHLINTSKELKEDHPNYNNYYNKINIAEIIDIENNLVLIRRHELNVAHRRIPRELYTNFVSTEENDNKLKQLAYDMLMNVIISQVIFVKIQDSKEALHKIQEKKGQKINELTTIVDAFIDPENLDGENCICVQVKLEKKPENLSEMKNKAQLVIAKH
jgi:hypothetical protein